MHGYNFTERVRTILALARQEAVNRRHKSVDTVHMLLGIIREGEGVAAAALQNLNIDLDTFQVRVAGRLLPGGTRNGEPDALAYSTREKRILERAIALARDLNHHYVGSEHLLLALLREPKGLAAKALAEVGVTFDVARDEVLRLLGVEPLRDEPPAPSGAIASIVIEVQRHDGTQLRGEFMSKARALRFIRDLGDETAV